MIIHKSHSKNELVNMIDKYHISIKNPKQYRKVELSALLVDRIKKLDSIVPVEDLPHLTLIELKLYLIKIHPKKTLTIKQKHKVIFTCKRLKHFCRNGYNVLCTDYDTIDDVYNDAVFIKPYGDIPSVRKSLIELNNNPNKPYDVDPVISPYCLRELELKQKLKQSKLFVFEYKVGKFSLTFN